MLPRSALLALAASAVLVAHGCSSNSGDGPVAPTAEAGASPEASAPVAPPPPGACLNDADRATTARTDFGTSKDLAIDDLAADRGVACALKGLTESALEACTRDGLVEGTGGALSQGCATCYSLSVACAAERCVADCLPEPGGVACGTCRCGGNSAGRNCVRLFEECSGEDTGYCASLGDAGADGSVD